MDYAEIPTELIEAVSDGMVTGSPKQKDSLLLQKSRPELASAVAEVLVEGL